MFSLALVLASRGQMGEAAQWFEQARQQGPVDFLRSALATLQDAGPTLTSFAARYAEAIERCEG